LAFLFDRYVRFPLHKHELADLRGFARFDLKYILMSAGLELAMVVESILQWLQHNTIRARILRLPHDF
jgi:hypothetical protein